MTVILWCVLAAVAAGVIVYALRGAGIRRLERELEQARSAGAVAEARHADLNAAHQALQASQSATQREHAETLAAWQARSADLDARVQVLASREQAALQAEKAAGEKLASAEAEARGAQQRLAQASADQSALQATHRGLLEQVEKQRQWIEEQTRHFQQAVVLEATRLMDERGKAFTELNRKEVDAVVAPFKVQLEEFRRRVDEIHTVEARARGALDEKILSLTQLNRTVSDQAERLVKALTVSSKSTGDWGETILARILEDSGLRAGRDYKLQVAIKGAGGEDYRPDAILYLPDDRQLVVDSKVSNRAWTEYCAASDEAQREALLKEHLLSLRTHIKGLAAKEYARSPDLKTVDFVLMFVPVEAALLTALVSDDGLYAEAYRQRIILVTPTTLMAVVRMALGLWTFQTRMESIEEIVEVGRKLYEKLTNFAESFVDVGRAIEDAKLAHAKAQGQLASGRGNAVKLAEQLKELGVTPSAGKAMPEGLLGAE
jgi:DNA recombination protein RmuC